VHVRVPDDELGPRTAALAPLHVPVLRGEDMSTEVYFDQLCANCQHRRGSHREDSERVMGETVEQWQAQGCMVRGCRCTAWRAA
jgi:hypothetical protein